MMDRLRLACFNLGRGVKHKNDEKSNTTINATASSAAQRVGVQRHPCVLTLKDNAVCVQLSTNNYAPAVSTQPEGDVSMAERPMFAYTARRNVDEQVLRDRTRRSRSIAYNSDRLFVALQLSKDERKRTNNTNNTSVILCDGSCDNEVEHVLALALALALHSSWENEYGTYNVHVSNPTNVKTALRRVAERAQAAERHLTS